MECVFDRQGRHRNLLGAFAVSNEVFTKSSRAEQDLKWAQIWNSKLVEFHARRGTAAAVSPPWEFTAEDVIVFLQWKRDAGTPAWKRAKIIHGLMVHGKRR